MPSMIDAQCPKCRKRFGWSGTMRDMPPCPRCGYRPPQEELDADEAQMQEMRTLLLTKPGSAIAEVRRQQRIQSGLTLRQAAKLLGITAEELSSYEHGRTDPSPELAAKMVEVYGLST